MLEFEEFNRSFGRILNCNLSLGIRSENKNILFLFFGIEISKRNEKFEHGKPLNTKLDFEKPCGTIFKQKYIMNIFLKNVVDNLKIKIKENRRGTNSVFATKNI